MSLESPGDAEISQPAASTAPSTDTRGTAEVDPHPGPIASDSPGTPTKPELPLLWNPNAAANWSLLFSPILGAWIHARNWRTMGCPDEAHRSMTWVWGTLLAALSPFAFLVIKVPYSFATGGVITLWLWVVLGWYFEHGGDQASYIRSHYPQGYRKRSLLLPLALAVLGMIAGTAVNMIIQDAIRSGRINPPYLAEHRAIDEEEGRLFNEFNKMMDDARAARISDAELADQLRDRAIPGWQQLTARTSDLANAQRSPSLGRIARCFELRTNAMRALEEGLRTGNREKINEFQDLNQQAEALAAPGGSRKR